MNIEELQERLLDLNTQANDIRAKCEAEKRDLTVEESETLDQLLNASERTVADIDRLARLADQTAALTQGTGRRTQPDNPDANPGNLGDDDDDDAPAVNGKRSLSPPQAATTQGPPPKRRSGNGGRLVAMPPQKNGGFGSLGEMAYHVMLACRTGHVADPRLHRLAAATTYGTEGSGAEGGFTIPPDFRNAIMEKVLGEDSLISRTDQITVSGNTFTMPTDETTPWQTTGGIQAYWGGEGEVKTQSKPLIGETTIKLNKIYALVPMTDELLEDASAMDSYLRRKAPAKINFAVNLAIVQGNGVGKPLGILNAPSTISVAKESGQVADTLIGNNVIKMFSRLYAPNRGRAVWLINQDIEPQLYKLSLPGTDNTGNAVTGWGGLVYMPAGGLSGSPFGTLFGRPVIPTQACETLGDKGDIIFADLSQYLTLLKSGVNPRVDVSIHMWFDQDITAFRFVLRIGGYPWWASSIAARDGNTSYSWAVTLDERG